MIKRKKIKRIVVLLLVGVIAYYCGRGTRKHVTEDMPKLEDLIIQMSPGQKYLYGESDETKVLVNLVTFKELIANLQEQQKLTNESVIRLLEATKKNESKN